MKLRKIIAGLSAAAIAASCFAMTSMTASAANKVSDYVYPSETDTEKNDGWYSICAIGFFMNNGWTGWNQYDDLGNIDENGILEATFDISEGLTFGGKGDDGTDHDNTLGMMGIMICNLPEENFPYEVKVLEADFTPKGGDKIELDSFKDLTELVAFPETGSDARLIVRATPDEKNDIAASPEAEGMDQAGGFKGGTLHFKLDFGAPPAPADESKADSSKADDSKSGDSGSGSSGSGNSGSGSSGSSTTTTSSAADTSSESDTSSAAEESTSDTTTTTTGDEAKSDDASSATDVKSSESKTDSSSKTETTTTTTTTTTNTTTTTADTGTGVKIASADELGTSSESASDATEASATGIGGTLAFGLGALALAGIVVSRKK